MPFSSARSKWPESEVLLRDMVSFVATINKGGGCEAAETGEPNPFAGLGADMDQLAFHQPVLLREAV